MFEGETVPGAEDQIIASEETHLREAAAAANPESLIDEDTVGVMLSALGSAKTNEIMRKVLSGEELDNDDREKVKQVLIDLGIERQVH